MTRLRAGKLMRLRSKLELGEPSDLTSEANRPCHTLRADSCPGSSEFAVSFSCGRLGVTAGILPLGFTSRQNDHSPFRS